MEQGLPQGLPFVSSVRSLRPTCRRNPSVLFPTCLGELLVLKVVAFGADITLLRDVLLVHLG